MARPLGKPTSSSEGSVVVTILIIMLFLSTLIFGVTLLANSNLFRAQQRIYLLEAQYSAESGADASIAILNSGSSSYTGTTSDVTVFSNSRYKATYATTVTSGSSSNQMIITSTGKVYVPSGATTPTYTRKIKVTASLSSTTTASGLMSRNIIDVNSSVKTITGTNVFVNGYLYLRSNSTTMYAQSITVAGKDTSSSNCSIEGHGALAKPSWLTSSQTATIDVAYSNCINPPGNISNTNFTVTPNDSSIVPLQSTYIPWSQYMDGTYQNSPTGCADWTGSGTITIPSTGNTKKTHYPDSGSGIASTCGTSGDLNLGSNTYNITDNVHIRANLCATSACSPTFNNTSGSIKYVFIEGTINFANVYTVSGSSPLVFITYGADPGTHSSNFCPYGDSIYLGGSGSDTINAPAIYFLATNDLCIDKAKFGANPALGGLGAKNLFIAANSGTPFDLNLNSSFPLTSIPTNLSWRASGYQRL